MLIQKTSRQKIKPNNECIRPKNVDAIKNQILTKIRNISKHQNLVAMVFKGLKEVGHSKITNVLTVHIILVQNYNCNQGEILFFLLSMH